MKLEYPIDILYILAGDQAMIRRGGNLVIQQEETEDFNKA